MGKALGRKPAESRILPVISRVVRRSRPIISSGQQEQKADKWSKEQRAKEISPEPKWPRITKIRDKKAKHQIQEPKDHNSTPEPAAGPSGLQEPVIRSKQSI
jgi:hypothetical protein